MYLGPAANLCAQGALQGSVQNAFGAYVGI